MKNRIEKCIGFLSILVLCIALVLLCIEYKVQNLRAQVAAHAERIAALEPVPFQPGPLVSIVPEVEETQYGFAAKGLIDLERIVKIESGGDPRATSSAGARGLCQIMRPTWEEFCDEDFDKAYDPILNLKVSRIYFAWLYDYLSKRVPTWETLPIHTRQILLLTAYNWGIGNLRKYSWDCSVAPRETLQYVERYFE